MAIETPLKGFIGESIKRKEDDRFIRGKGNYVDDIVLPGMLHMAILRSPFAHARIHSIDTTAAQALPGVVAVVTGKLLEQHKLAWMPTLSGDTQAVLATDKVRFQGQEVACVIATGPATLYMTSQAPHAHRTLFAIVAGLPEQNIRIVSPDIGGGFGNKVPIYPGYVVATAASLLIGKPVKWVEDRSENLISTGFARDFHMKGEMAMRNDGRILGIRVKLLSDNGAFYADAQPTKFRAGLFHIVTGSYDIPAAHVVADGAYTNKAPGGVAYRCSFRVTEASYLIERLVETAAIELNQDPAELRVHPTGKAILKLGVKSQGQGHETTFAQIVAEELGIPAADVEVQEGDTDNTPYGLGTYASRSTPVGGAATAMVSRKLRDKA